MSKEVVVHAGSINLDHVHMPIDIADMSVSRALQYLKVRVRVDY
jgi:REP element-mobilizing transposase RayT